jgi:predicted HNH restriction endonuclease
LDVHHNTYENYGDERSQDLTVLCGECHGMFHGRLEDAS